MPCAPPETSPSSAGQSSADRRARLIELNDILRTTGKGGKIQMTPSVYDLDPRLKGRAFSALAQYNAFHRDSDHDAGILIFAGYSFIWQIEYRSSDGEGRSPEPSDPDKTLRVLTLAVSDDLLTGNLSW